MTLFIGALLGFLSIIVGAYTEHGLQHYLDEHQLGQLLTAIKYNQLYAIIIVSIGLFAIKNNYIKQLLLLKWVISFFIIGVVIFSGSIYIAVILNLPWILLLTPIGGITLIVAWLLLSVFAWVEQKTGGNS